jgi:hypothetical protein
VGVAAISRAHSHSRHWQWVIMNMQGLFLIPAGTGALPFIIAFSVVHPIVTVFSPEIFHVT